MLTNYKRTWNRQYYQAPKKRSNLNFSTTLLESRSDTLIFNEQIILQHTYFIQQSIVFNAILSNDNIHNINQQLTFIQNYNITRRLIITQNILFNEQYLLRHYFSVPLIQLIVFDHTLLGNNSHNINQQFVFIENTLVSDIKNSIITQNLVFSNYLSRLSDDNTDFRSKPWLTLTRPDPVNEL